MTVHEHAGFKIIFYKDGIVFQCEPGRGLIITGAIIQSVPIEAIEANAGTGSRPGKYLCPVSINRSEILEPADYSAADKLKNLQRELDTLEGPG